MSLPVRDIVTPDLILGPDQQVLNDPTGLNPCPACNSYQADAPEGIHDHHSARKVPGAQPGDPRWNYPHCFKCGFRPGTNVAVSTAQLSREFAAFQAWREQQLEQMRANQPTINADLVDQNAQYKAEIEALRKQVQGGGS